MLESEKMDRRTARRERRRRKTEITISGIDFGKRNKRKNTSYRISKDNKYILKVEQFDFKRKKHSLIEEMKIMKKLNDGLCVSCPIVHEYGNLPDGRPYSICEMINNNNSLQIPDIILSLLEQKSFGIFQRDMYPDRSSGQSQHLIHDGSICYIIDYDQAIDDESLIDMPNDKFIDYVWQTTIGNSNKFAKLCGSKGNVLRMFKNGAFDFSKSTLLEKQITTRGRNLIYNSIDHNDIFVAGQRNSDQRFKILDNAEFEKNEKVLDVGCNLGSMANYLHDKGCDVTGIDMDQHVIKAAQMSSNIMKKKIKYYHVDVDKNVPPESYNTICLFSVLQHIENVQEFSNNIISDDCKRLIIECRLKERGQKFDNRWKRTTNWTFRTLNDLYQYIEKIFKGFKFNKNYGPVDRSRYIMEFTR